jgi:hypothetical protein
MRMGFIGFLIWHFCRALDTPALLLLPWGVRPTAQLLAVIRDAAAILEA